jgi:hypothetical protein
MQHLRQIAQAGVNYQKDWDQWMANGGNRSGVHPTGGYNLEKNWSEIWNTAQKPYDSKSPFWYEAVQPYISNAASVADAIASYKARTGATLNPLDGGTGGGRDKIREEIIRLVEIYTCPAKKQTDMGYGYNYDAPFGNHGCYEDASKHNFIWYVDPDYNVNTPPRPKTYPAYGYTEARAPIPILWYEDYIHASVLTVPSAQIGWCDTGLVTNDPNLDVDPTDWVENSTSNFFGFVRFPMHQYYTDTNFYKSAGLKTGSYYYGSWRPVPRHGEKAVCANFDGSAAAIHIRDIVGYGWFDDQCVYDNIPPHKPPVPPKPH